MVYIGVDDGGGGGDDIVDDDNDGDGLVCLEVKKRHEKRFGDGIISTSY